MNLHLQERCEGCLLGLALGDALGGLFEARSAESMRSRFSSVEQIFAYPQEEIWYTDDTQMTIGVAESLIEQGAIIESALCQAFVANYVPSRGYGFGARAVLEAMSEGRDYRQVAEQYFPGGSYGNGAAMRVAPVGLLFGDDHNRLWEQARLSALPTHLHPLGVEGAQLLAFAVGWWSRIGAGQFDRAVFYQRLLAVCQSTDYRAQIEQAAQIQDSEELARL